MMVVVPSSSTAAGPSIRWPARSHVPLEHAVLHGFLGEHRVDLPRLEGRGAARGGRQRGQARVLERERHGKAKVEELHGDVGRGIAVRAPVRLVEAAAERGPVREIADGDRHGVLLAEVAQVGGSVHHGRADGRQDPLDLALHLEVSGPGPRGVGCHQRLEHRAHQVVAQIGGEHPPRRERRRRRRHDDARNAQLARHGDGVKRSAAAIRHQRVVARVEAALGRDAADGERHLDVGEPDDAGGGRVAPEAERHAELLVDGAGGGRGLERHRAPEEADGVDAAEHDVGVGHRGLGAAARVAHGAGIGARAPRTEGERAPRVDPGDGPAAGAHLLDVDHRDAHRVAVHVVLVRGLDEAAVDDGALRRRAAHVERDEPVRAEDSREARAARGARRRPRLHRVHGLRPGRLERERAAIGLRDEHLAAEAASAERPAERAEVAVHDGPDIGVDDGGARPLVLPPLLRDPMRRRDEGAGQLAGDDLGGALLVGRVAIREEEDHRHGLDALGGELARGVPDGVLVEGHEDLAARAEALRHLEASPSRHERCRTPVEHVVHLEEIAASDLEDVAEALGRDEARPGPCSLEERIDADGRAVDDEAAVRELRARLVDAAEHAVEQIARRAERLAGGDGARGLVEHDQVREGAADVDADSLCHASAPQPRRGSRIRARRLTKVGRSIAHYPGRN